MNHFNLFAARVSRIIRIVLIVCFFYNHAYAQDKKSKSSTYVDDQGIFRWTKDDSPLTLFGVNYTTPFAYAYRAHKSLGVPPEKAIDEDVYHFARLGLDAFRVHVWDCEISDTIGNLIENEHLKLFDYLLNRLKERGIKILITPIAYWGNGYPEPEEKTPGFSTKYGKDNCLTNPDAIKAQENYLFQLVNHVNTYTGMAYKDDPDIIAFEVCNEPHHQGTAKETTTFINRMVSAIRKSGCTKPVFYNVSHSTNLAEAYYSAEIQGGTFQWYPTGLVHGHEIRGNFLPNVSVYPIPFDTVPGFQKKTKVVYEFDAADVGRSYIYPYIAKAYRETGFQFATQFAYDPLHLAYANTEYQTHYMNLAYAPQKALSLKIAGEVFHRLPQGMKSGSYPNDTLFDVFRVSYKNELAEMASDEKFFYTNYTATVPPDISKLKHIAGYGSSPVVGYQGCGAYFLDRLEKGVWRLEVMPDAIWVKDPFERASPEKEVSVIIRNKWPMTINLPDLGPDFSFTGLNDGNVHKGISAANTLIVAPGTYLLMSKGKKSGLTGDDRWNNILLKEFIAPPTNCNKTYVIHQPPEEISEGHAFKPEAKVVSAVKPEKVTLFVYGRRWRPEVIEMENSGAYTYTADIDTSMMRQGFLRYYISVTENKTVHTYPSGNEGLPTDWDWYDQNPFQIRVVDSRAPVLLFDAASDGNEVYGNSWFRILPSKNPGASVLSMNARNLQRGEHNISARFYFAGRTAQRAPDLKSFSRMVLDGYSLTGEPEKIQLGMVDNLGFIYAGWLTIQPESGKYSISLNELRKAQTIVLPDVYPTFLPFYLDIQPDADFDITTAESIQISIGPEIPENEYDKAHGIAIGKIYLE